MKTTLILEKKRQKDDFSRKKFFSKFHKSDAKKQFCVLI